MVIALAAAILTACGAAQTSPYYIEPESEIDIAAKAGYSIALNEECDECLMQPWWILSQELEETMLLLRETEGINNFSVSWGPNSELNHIEVDLIRYTEEEKARFREEVLDSPMIIFRCPRARRIPEDKRINQPFRVCPVLDGNITAYVIEQTETYVIIEIRNNTEFTISMNFPYELEFYDNGVWRMIPSIRIFHSQGLGIGSNETIEVSTCLKDHLHLMTAPGLYRIRRSVLIDTLHCVVAEFYWE